MSDTDFSPDTFDNSVDEFLDPPTEIDIDAERADEDELDEETEPLVQAVYDLRSPEFNKRRTANILLERASVNAMGPLLDVVTDAGDSFRVQVQRRLTALGPDFLVDMLAGLQHPEPAARETMAAVFGALEDSRAIPALVELLADPEEEVQRAAASALEQINTLRALEAVNVWKAQSDSDS